MSDGELEQAVVEHGTAWVDDHAAWLLDLLVDLVERPSVTGDEGTRANPESVVGRLWAVLSERTDDQVALDAQPLPRDVDYVDRPRENLYATIAGGGDRRLICTSHTDVVPAGAAGDWPSGEPFAVIEGTARYVGDQSVVLDVGGGTYPRSIRPAMARTWEARGVDEVDVLVGRGVYDNKASVVGLVGGLLALQHGLSRAGAALDGELVHAHLVDEEVYQYGVKQMVGWGDHGDWLGRRPPAGDVASVVLEGSYGFAPVVGHRGLVWATARAEGQSAHASTPALGRNAVVAIAKLLSAADEERFRDELASLFVDDELLGPLSVAPGTTVVGGDVEAVASDGTVDRGGRNTVPDWCEATFDIRIPRWAGFPGGVDELRTRLADTIVAAADRAGTDCSVAVSITDDDFFPPVAIADSLADAGDHPLVARARRTTDEVLGYTPAIEIAPGVTDAAFLSHGTRQPTLVEYGPAGGLSHEPLEYVERDQVIAGAEVMLRFAVDHLGVSPEG